MQLWQPTRTTTRRRVISADNGVYILKTRKGKGYEYRVATIYAIGNIFKDTYYLYNAFEHANVFAIYKEAEKLAFETDRILMSEYDVLVIDQFADKEWEEIRLAAVGPDGVNHGNDDHRETDKSRLCEATQEG